MKELLNLRKSYFWLLVFPAIILFVFLIYEIGMLSSLKSKNIIASAEINTDYFVITNGLSEDVIIECLETNDFKNFSAYCGIAIPTKLNFENKSNTPVGISKIKPNVLTKDGKSLDVYNYYSMFLFNEQGYRTHFQESLVLDGKETYTADFYLEIPITQNQFDHIRKGYAEGLQNWNYIGDPTQPPIGDNLRYARLNSVMKNLLEEQGDALNYDFTFDIVRSDGAESRITPIKK